MSELPGKAVEISVEEVARLRDAGDEFLFIDCRERDEAETAAIDGAVLMPMSEWDQFEGDLAAAAGQHVIVHCHHGSRSLRVARWLRANGFPTAQSMAGGIDQWSQQVDPAVPRY